MSCWKTWLGMMAMICGLQSAARSEPIAFLVGEYPSQKLHNDSYVIVIDDANGPLISHARTLAAWVEAGEPEASMPDDRIVVTEIQPGSNDINRNWLVPHAQPWSWHAVGEPSFVGSTIEILDGWPTFIEDDVPGWMANTNGYVGFWGYTVIRELGPVAEIPEPSALVLAALGLCFSASRLRCQKRASMGQSFLSR